jgi:glyoxylase-like metal-dependent hydrolase (beta-lactamase superfamily II)
MLKRIILTHEDADHVWGNLLFPGAEIIAHRSVLPERMKQVAEPKDTQQLQHGVGNVIKNFVIKVTHPGLQAAGKQLLEDYNIDGIQLVFPMTL